MAHRTVGRLVGALLFAALAACSSESEPGATGPRGGSGGSGAQAGSGGADFGESGGAGALTGGGGMGGTASGGGGSGGLPEPPSRTFVYVATGDWGNSGNGRIRIYELDAVSERLVAAGDVAAGTLPSYMSFDLAGRTLYVGDEEEGVLRAFSVDRTSGGLSPKGSSVATAGHPVYVSIDATAQYLLSAYYNEGSVEVFSLGGDGAIGASVAARSTGAQSHAIVLAPDNGYVFVPNKGSNTISQLVFGSDGSLEPNTPPSVATAGGPRHLTFHPTRPLAYVVTELDNTVHSYTHDATRGLLTEIDVDSTLSSELSGATTGADIHVAPDGRHVYVSNRSGSNSSIAAFAVSEDDGSLGPIGHTLSHGETPRNFGIAPGGGVVLVANQDSNNVAFFTRDAGRGILTFVATTDVGDKPACLKFLVLDGS